MGEAKRKREAGERVSWCRTCTLCCSLPEIKALDKPVYRPCRHLANDGCGIFGRPERPGVCIAFQCAYLKARTSGSPDRNIIPHPIEAGAYFNIDPQERLIVLFVDPERPQLWKASAIVDYIRPHLQRGYVVQIIDRGRRMNIATEALLEEILKIDYVAYADSQGWTREFPEYLEHHKV